VKRLTLGGFKRKFGITGLDEIDSDPNTLTAYIKTLREYADGGWMEQTEPENLENGIKPKNTGGNSGMRLSKQLRDRWYARCLNISVNELDKEKKRWETRRENWGKLSFVRHNLKANKVNPTIEEKYFETFKGDLCSVELECVFESAEMIPSLKSVGRYLVDKEDDGSLEYYPQREDRNRDEDNEDESECSDDWGAAEFKVTFRHERPLRLRSVVDKLNACGAEVNTTCGMHLHLDQRGISSAMASKRAKRLIKCLPALTQIVAPSRLRNSYCHINRPIRRGVNYRHQTNRYLAINHASAYLEHTTTENRLHGGTLDFWKIMGWVDLNKWIMRSAEVDAVADANSLRHPEGEISVSFDDMIRFKTLPETIRSYMWRRYRQFHPAEAITLREKLLREDQHRLTDGYAVS
jgi:hypothetical protein